MDPRFISIAFVIGLAVGVQAERMGLSGAASARLLAPKPAPSAAPSAAPKVIPVPGSPASGGCDGALSK